MPVGPSSSVPEYEGWFEEQHRKTSRKNRNRLKSLQTTREAGGRPDLVPLNKKYRMLQQDIDALTTYTSHTSELSDVYLASTDKKGGHTHKSIQTPADYIDYAFENASQAKHLVTQECADGHIKSLTYNPLYLLLKVEFRERDKKGGRDDTCVFFNLPADVAEKLLYYAKYNTSAYGVDGKQHSAVGVEFWNVVRVRGQGNKRKARCAFQYTEGGPKGAPYDSNKGVGPKGQPAMWSSLDSQKDMRYTAQENDSGLDDELIGTYLSNFAVEGVNDYDKLLNKLAETDVKRKETLERQVDDYFANDDPAEGRKLFKELTKLIMEVEGVSESDAEGKIASKSSERSGKFNKLLNWRESED